MPFRLQRTLPLFVVLAEVYEDSSFSPHPTPIFIPLLYVVFQKPQFHLQNFSMQSAREGATEA